MSIDLHKEFSGYTTQLIDRCPHTDRQSALLWIWEQCRYEDSSLAMYEALFPHSVGVAPTVDQEAITLAWVEGGRGAAEAARWIKLGVPPGMPHLPSLFEVICDLDDLECDIDGAESILPCVGDSLEDDELGLLLARVGQRELQLSFTLRLADED